MNNDRINEALAECDEIILAVREDLEPTAYDHGHKTAYDIVNKLSHLRAMIAQVALWPAERIEKKFRWLGFIQGTLWALGLVTIDTLKKQNAPKAVERNDWEPR